MAYQFPTHCPSCGTGLTRYGAHYFCLNHDCPDQVRQRFQHFGCKGTLDWDGFGPAQVDALMQQCGCRKFSDLFAVSQADISRVLGPGQTAKFLAERERVKTAPLWRKLAALGIEGVGQTSCKELCQQYHSLATIIALPDAKLTELLGPVAAANFLGFLRENIVDLERCQELGFMFDEPEPEAPTGKLVGLSFCLTGAMESGTRPQVAKFIESHGGTVKGSVGKGLSYLVVGEAGGASKANAAKKWGTKCISEAELYAMVGMEVPRPAGCDGDAF